MIPLLLPWVGTPFLALMTQVPVGRATVSVVSVWLATLGSIRITLMLSRYLLAHDQDNMGQQRVRARELGRQEFLDIQRPAARYQCLLFLLAASSRPFSAEDDSPFSYPYSPAAADNEVDSMEQAKAHINATVTQLFYTSNMVHDLFYR